MQAAAATDTDRMLSERVRLGMSGAFDALVAKYQTRAYRLAWRMTGNASDSEEIVQEAFLRAHRSMGTFRGDSRFGTWLFRIVVNEALMRKRAARRRPTLFLGESPELRGDERTMLDEACDEGTEQILQRKRVTEQVRHALDALDDAHRTALVLRDLEGLSSKEAAEILDLEPETVRQRAHRARLKLRRMLGHLREA